jgi:hypothetical protein
VLIAYADESGHAADPKVDHFGLVGLVASAERWERFRTDWSAALAEFGVSALHMREFAHRLGPFRGWSEEQRRAFLSRLLAVVDELRPLIFGSVIALAAWRRLAEADQKRFVDPYFACAQEFAYLAAVHGYTVGQDRVRIVLSDTSEFRGRGRLLFEALTESRTMPPAIDSYAYAPMAEELALQAADLVAYEVVLGHDQVAKGATELRYPLQRLRAHDSFVRYIDDDYLGRQVQGVVGGLPFRERAD